MTTSYAIVRRTRYLGLAFAMCGGKHQIFVMGRDAGLPVYGLSAEQRS